MTDPVQIREANSDDFEFVVRVMNEALSRFYDGDHTKHAERIFTTHISGGADRLGFFSTFQKMFIADVDGQRAGMIHLVGKRQGTLKISPLIVEPSFRKGQHVGNRLLELAETYARDHGFRQVYCTVAKENEDAARFFVKNKFNITGQSDGHYKNDLTETIFQSCH
jgi:ribosomal protein S18 acetylase RimI-like enzyme